MYLIRCFHNRETKKYHFGIRSVWVWFMAALILLWAGVTAGRPAYDQKPDKGPTEYEMKAVFIYNYLKYTVWPEDKVKPNGKDKEQVQAEPIVVGVIGKDPFGKAWKKIEGKKVNDRKIVIRQLGEFDKLSVKPDKSKGPYSRQDLKKCRVLFICPSEEKNLKKIIDLVKTSSVMTVGQTSGFLEKGGIVNFLLEKKKVCFEINLDAAKLAQLQIKTTVLKLAKRVLQKKKTKTSRD
ncbi:YfiR family protein [Planctomycetota bacterium]